MARACAIVGRTNASTLNAPSIGNRERRVRWIAISRIPRVAQNQ